MRLFNTKGNSRIQNMPSCVCINSNENEIFFYKYNTSNNNSKHPLLLSLWQKLIWSPKQPWKAGKVINPILQMESLRHYTTTQVP